MDKSEAYNAWTNAEKKLSDAIGRVKYKKYNLQVRLEKIIEIDEKIPPIDINLYYPN